MPFLLRTGLMTSRTLAKHKVGRTDAREWSGLFYDQKVPLPPDGRRSHALEIMLQFCPVLGAKPELRGADDLSPLTQLDRRAVMAVAAFVGSTRLIDNRVLAP